MGKWSNDGAIEVAECLAELDRIIGYTADQIVFEVTAGREAGLADLCCSGDPFGYYLHMCCGTLGEVLPADAIEGVADGDVPRDIANALENIMEHAAYWQETTCQRWSQRCTHLLGTIEGTLGEYGLDDKGYRVWSRHTKLFIIERQATLSSAR